MIDIKNIHKTLQTVKFSDSEEVQIALGANKIPKTIREMVFHIKRAWLRSTK